MQQSLHTSEQPFTEHLRELRERIIRCLVYISLGAIISYIFIDSIIIFLSKPLVKITNFDNFVFKAIHEAFYVYLKLSILCGIIFTSPFWIYEFWMFIAPGLYLYEQNFIKFLFFISGFFFLFGALFGYYFLLPPVINFLINYGDKDLIFLPSINNYYSFIIRSLLGFGIAFLLPVIICLACLIDLINFKSLQKTRKYAIILVLIISAFLTPTPDIINQCLLAIPLYILYEFSLLLVLIIDKFKKND